MCLAGIAEVAPAPVGAQKPPSAEQQVQYFDDMIKAAQGAAPQAFNLDRGYPEMYAANAAQKAKVLAAPVFTAFPASVPPVPPPPAATTTPPAGNAAAETDAAEAKENHALDKTKLCKFFIKGQCRRGSACTFAHGRRQLRPQPDLFRTQLCIDFVNGGGCSFGASCRYAHSSEELRVADLKAGKSSGAKRSGSGSAAAAPAPSPVAPAMPPPPAAPAAPAPSDRAAAEALARELESVQQHAQRLQAQLFALQNGGAARKVEEPLNAPRRLTQPPAPLQAVTPPTQDFDRSSNASTSPGFSRHVSLSACSFREDEAASSHGWASSSDEEPLIDVVVRVRNTFVDMAPAEPEVLRRTSSSPCLAP